MEHKHKGETALNTIGQIAIPVTDIDRAVRFYRDSLGIKFLFEAPPDLAFFDCDGVRLMLDGPARDKAGQSTVLYFKVDNIKQTYKTLANRDVHFNSQPHIIAKMPDHELWMAFFTDPDNNQLVLMSEVR